MKSILLAGAVGLALGGLASSANASVIVAKATGVVVLGSDSLGTFGPVGADLTGDSVSVVYTIDTSKGFLSQNPPQSSNVFGGGSFGVASPVTAVLTINGTSHDFLGTYNGQAWQIAPAAGYSELEYSVDDRTYSSDGSQDLFVSTVAYSSSDGFVASWDITNPPTTVPVADLGYGFFDVNTFPASGGFTSSSVEWQTTSLTVSAVPEPATWAMLILGLAGVGAALRRRKDGLAIASA